MPAEDWAVFVLMILVNIMYNEGKIKKMRKIFAIIMVFIMMLSVTACSNSATPTPSPEATNTPEPEQPNEALELKDYTIVYPSDYTELRMDIVNELKEVIKAVSGSEINAVADSQAVDGKKIILASTKTEHSLKTQIDGFDDAMDYVVARDNDNIVLGGKNYYSDMRAVYDFMENYLGYTSAENTYTGKTKKLEGVNVIEYTKPDFLINAVCWARFDSEWQVRDVRDANFNYLTTHDHLYDEQMLHNMTKWCAKYDIQLLWNTNTRPTLKAYELYSDCPIVYGAYIWDEPAYGEFEKVQNLCDQFKENYSQYGWEPFVNFAGGRCYDVENSEYLKDLDVMCFDWYFFVGNHSGGSASTLWGEGSLYLTVMQSFMNTAKKHDMEFWTYIQSYRRGKTGDFFTDRAYLWQMYLSLCFDSKAILYFEYANNLETPDAVPWMDKSSLVVSESFTKGDNYYQVQKDNAEILKMQKLLSEYDNVGAYTVAKREDQYYADFEEYKDFGAIADIDDSKNSSLNGQDTAMLVGCFDKKEGDGKAVILMNLDILEKQVYAVRNTRIKFNGEKVTVYENGEPKVLTPDADGYYNIKMPNGKCYVITIE